MPDSPSPRELESSEQLARAIEENARIRRELAQSQGENKLLREKIDVLIKRLWSQQ